MQKDYSFMKKESQSEISIGHKSEGIDAMALRISIINQLSS